MIAVAIILVAIWILIGINRRRKWAIMASDVISFIALLVVAFCCACLVLRRSYAAAAVLAFAGFLPFLSYLSNAYRWDVPFYIELILFNAGGPLLLVGFLLSYKKRALGGKCGKILIALMFAAFCLAAYISFMMWALMSVPA